MTIYVIVLSLLIVLLNVEMFANESTTASSSSSLESRMAEIEIIEVTAQKPLVPNSQIDIDTDVTAIIEQSILESSNPLEQENTD